MNHVADNPALPSSSNICHQTMRMRCHIGEMRKCFSVSVSFLLVLVAAAKLTAIWQHKQFINLPDQAFSSITTGDSMKIAVILEVVVAVFMFLKRTRLSGMLACSCLVSAFACYRMLTWASFSKKPCPCFGGVFDLTGLPQRFIDAIPVAILCYMGIGSLFFLWLAKVEDISKHSQM